MIIGVTGGVGTGKSTVLEYLRTRYNAAVILADDVARDLMMPDGASYKAVVSEFGDEILTDGPGSMINRKKLADIVFNDDEKLKKLNSLTHPAVRKKIRDLINNYQAQGIKLIIIEAALYIQAGYTELSDELWLVHADYETRVKRLEKSRGYTREKTDSIINNQMSEDEMRRFADFIIDNSGTDRQTFEQIDKYLNHLQCLK